MFWHFNLQGVWSVNEWLRVDWTSNQEHQPIQNANDSSRIYHYSKYTVHVSLCLLLFYDFVNLVFN